MTKVYLLKNGSSTVAVFSTQAKADDNVAVRSLVTGEYFDHEYSIEEADFDPPVPMIYDEWLCQINLDDGDFIAEKHQKVYDPAESHVCLFYKSAIATSGVSAKHCRDIAVDFREQHLQGNIDSFKVYP